MRAKKTKRLIRIIVFIVAVAVLAVLLTSLDSKDMNVDAASLNHIDEIVAHSGTFNILEIVPDTAGATVGYYIDGQEPISGWKTALSALTSPAERSDYVNSLFGRLAARDILSGSDTTPLSYTYFDAQNNSYYTEAYEVDDPQNWSILPLDERESTVLTGTFTPAEDGPYRAAYAYTPAQDGGYVQNIDYFTYVETPDYNAGAYYYDPVFTLITADTDLGAISGYTVYMLDGQGRYAVDPEMMTVADVIAAGGLDVTLQYFYVDPAATGAPGAFHYEAVTRDDDADDSPGDGFTEPASGPSYFTRDITSFTYVGTSDNYAYSEEGSDTWTVNYDITSITRRASRTTTCFKTLVFGLDGSTMDALGRDGDRPPSRRRDNGRRRRGRPRFTCRPVRYYLQRRHDGLHSGQRHRGRCPPSPSTTLLPTGYPVIVDYAIIDGISQWTTPEQQSTMQNLCHACAAVGCRGDGPERPQRRQPGLVAALLHCSAMWTARSSTTTSTASTPSTRTARIILPTSRRS